MALTVHQPRSGRLQILSYLKPPPMRILAVLTAALTLTGACGGDSPAATGATSGQVRGLILEVVSRNITEVETLRIRDEAGVVWTFTAEKNFVGFTPSHLVEHQLVGGTVLVNYTNRDGVLMMEHIGD